MEFINFFFLLAIFFYVTRMYRDIFRIKKKLGMDRDTEEEKWSVWNLVR